MAVNQTKEGTTNISWRLRELCQHRRIFNISKPTPRVCFTMICCNLKIRNFSAVDSLSISTVLFLLWRNLTCKISWFLQKHVGEFQLQLQRFPLIHFQYFPNNFQCSDYLALKMYDTHIVQIDCHKIHLFFSVIFFQYFKVLGSHSSSQTAFNPSPL